VNQKGSFCENLPIRREIFQFKDGGQKALDIHPMRNLHSYMKISLAPVSMLYYNIRMGGL